MSMAAAGVAVSMLPRTGLAADEQFLVDEHFRRITPALAASDKSVIVVTEVFSYMCIHCFNFDDQVEAWQKQLPEGVIFRRSPAIFSAAWQTLAQAFYTAEHFGIGEMVHKPLFETIHVQKFDMTSNAALGSLFSRYGVAQKDFEVAWQSEKIFDQLKQARDNSRAWGITAVPQLVVNGKFRLEGQLLDGDNVRMLEVASWLVEQERKSEGA